MALAPMADELPTTEERTVRVTVRRKSGAIMEAVRRLDQAGVEADDVVVRRPTLDDVFLSLTGHDTGSGADEPDNAEPEEVAA